MFGDDKKINFKHISQKYNVILINNWEELKTALDNNKLVMILDKKEVVHTQRGRGNGKKSIKQLLDEFKSDIVNIFEKEILVLRSEFNTRLDKVETNFNTRLDKVNTRLDQVNTRLDNLVKVNNLSE